MDLNDNLYERYANNIQGTFSGGPRKGGNGFEGTFKTTGNLCFNCGSDKHWARECPNKKRRPNTKAMTRSRAKVNKGQDKVWKNNQWKRGDIRPLQL